MHFFFQALDIDMSEARHVFDLLDMSGDGTIDADEFLNGCLHMHGPAKALDLLLLSREVGLLFDRHAANAELLTSNLEAILQNRQAILSGGKSGNIAEHASSIQPECHGPL